MSTAILGFNKKLLKAEVVSELPSLGISNKIYFVLNEDSTEDNRYDEYLWVKDDKHPNGYFEKVGYRYIDLTPYYTKTEVNKLLEDLTHPISDIIGLQSILDDTSKKNHNHDTVYSKLKHSHVLADITDSSSISVQYINSLTW